MQAHTHTAHRARQGGGIEYGVYFALIFAISLPVALMRMLLPVRGRARRFFITEAWSMAGMVTPRIFSA